MSIFSRILLPSLLIFILFSCAVKEGPSGGPEDTTKPTIIGVKPEPLSTDIPPDTKFHILFSKPMNREKTTAAVFLSPVFWDYPTYGWKGRELIVTPPEDLEKNKTYVLTIGADATGHHGNQMGTSYSFAFSTGSAIDSGFISGSIYLDKGRPTAYDIWAFSIEDTGSAPFLNDIPDFATQVDSTYGFELKNISSGNYVVVAVDDKNDDLFWDPTSESIGLPPVFIKLQSGESFQDFILRPERRDTIAAAISRVRTIDNRKITVELSQPVLDDLKLDTASFYIVASDSTYLAIEGAYIGREGSLVLETAAQEAEKTYRLKPGRLFSLWGNSFDTSGARFIGSPETDTTGPELLSTTPSNGSRATYRNDHIELIFSERIRAFGFLNAVSVIADSVDTLGFVPRWTYPNNIHLNFGTGIPREKLIEVHLSPGDIYDVAGNSMKDSTLSFWFRITPADTVGSVTIKTGKSGNIIGELFSRDAGKESYFVNVDEKGVFAFNSVLPGTYYFRYFIDSDSNGIWTGGVINPFMPAEWFFYNKDSIDVRARWTTDFGQMD
ncbi:MAG: Ig-like domain-containing protein [Candidatus Zixiibacteriota bacterium]|nr:MAG: Ig-like domain-containing protein [candidate division Zixibacteria bacterium]